MEENVKAKFAEIKKNIGKTVAVKYWSGGELKSLKGSLSSFDDENYTISIGYTMLNFASRNRAILSIVREDDVLYYEPYFINNYKGDTIEEISKAQEVVFGKEFASERKKEIENIEEEMRREDALDSESVKKFNEELGSILKETLPLVKEETREQWTRLCTNSGKSAYTVMICRMAIDMLKELSIGTSLEEVVQKICYDKYAADGTPEIQAVNAMIRFSPRGNEIAEEWKKMNNGVEVGKKMS